MRRWFQVFLERPEKQNDGITQDKQFFFEESLHSKFYRQPAGHQKPGQCHHIEAAAGWLGWKRKTEPCRRNTRRSTRSKVSERSHWDKQVTLQFTISHNGSHRKYENPTEWFQNLTRSPTSSRIWKSELHSLQRIKANNHLEEFTRRKLILPYDSKSITSF